MAVPTDHDFRDHCEALERALVEAEREQERASAAQVDAQRRLEELDDEIIHAENDDERARLISQQAEARAELVHTIYAMEAMRARINDLETDHRLSRCPPRRFVPRD